MIKAGITGAESRIGGELLRLLLLHPDVVVTTAYAGPGLASHPVTSVHQGLDGDTSLTFSNGGNLPGNIDVLFIADGNIPSQIPAGAKVIDITGHLEDAVYGLPELNRKPLVRGAVRATVPSATATSVTTALLPLARNLLLNNPIKATVTLGRDDATLPAMRDNEINDALKSLQSSFDAPIEISVTVDNNIKRGTTAIIETQIPISPEQIAELYLDYFDDHNLTHLLTRKATIDDIAGTAKCLISLGHQSQRQLQITSVIDGPLKGCAAQAIHLMNLMTGLHEKTGLALKATIF